MLQTKDWYCDGCLCNHGGRVKKHGALGDATYCEQTYYHAAKAYDAVVDKFNLAQKYRGQNGTR
jgi:hypothetical protein